MLKTKVSKIAVVALVAALAIVGVGASHAPAAHAASDYVFVRSMTIGATGSDVIALQAYLNNTSCCHVAESGAGSRGNETSTFGPLTRAALAKFQASVGISPAVGYFGPITMAYVNAHALAIGNLPAGCTSTAGYSATTGVKCDTPVGGSLPAGCTSTAGYSSTTGVKCDTGVNPSQPSGDNNGPLHGGAGDITVTEKNSGTENQVLEGDTKAKVLGFEVDPEGSDVSITSVRVEFEHTDSTGSDRLERYADKVYVLMGDKVVGSADASDFTKNSNVYSRNIPVSNAVVRDNVKTRFSVAVDAQENVDSDDLGTDWDVALGAVRFGDATGAILTNNDGDGISGGAIENTFTFEDLSSAGDVKLTVSENDATVNDAHTETVDTSSDTNDVSILSFSLKAKSTDMTINNMAFNASSSGAGVTEIANDFRLLQGGTEVGTVSIWSGSAKTDGSGDCTGTDVGFASTTATHICIQVTDLDNDDVNISEDQTEDFTLVADINDTEASFTSGDSISPALNADSIDAEDANGDPIATSDLTGSANAGPLTFLSSGVSVDFVSEGFTEYVDPNNANNNEGQFTLTFKVTAIDEDVWVELDSAQGTSSNSLDTGASYFIEDDAGNRTTLGTSTDALSYVQGSGGTQEGSFIRISDGEHASFKLSVSYNPTTTGYYKIQLESVGFNDSSAAAANNEQVPLPAEDFDTEPHQVHS